MVYRYVYNILLNTFSQKDIEMLRIDLIESISSKHAMNLIQLFFIYITSSKLCTFVGEPHCNVVPSNDVEKII